MPRPRSSYQLTAALAATSVGAGVLCLAPAALGRTYRLHAQRPGPEQNARIDRTDVRVEPKPALIRVEMLGPLEQRAGYHDPCAGWTDGHDALCDRLCAALVEGDVLLVVDCPGGACAGLQQGVARVLAVKAQYNRRVTVWADEMIASAAYWWAAAVGDEIFVPAAGKVGSIGARAAHESIAGALEKEGVTVTYFADPPEKVALAPEMPLSSAGRARGERDVQLAAEAFRAAVCGSAIGVRYGLTPEALVALGADVLTGQAAVAAGLVDGVASEEEVTAYALRLAERGAQDPGAPAGVRAHGGTMELRRGAVRAEDDDRPGAEDDEAPPSKPAGEKPGREIPTACAKCNVENDPDAKFCKGCGASMATMPEDGAEDEAPPSSAKPGASLPARIAPSASFAEIFGLDDGASLPAQKSAAIDLRQLRDFASRITGETSPDKIIGGLSALADDAAAAPRLRRERDRIRSEQARAKRWELARRLVALDVPGRSRGEVYTDAVRPDGSRVLDAAGKPLLRLAPEYAEMSLGTFEALVARHERSAPRRSPFEPDRERARHASHVVQHGDPAARIERAKQHPVVLASHNRAGNVLTLEKLAAAFVAANLDLQPLGAPR